MRWASPRAPCQPAPDDSWASMTSAHRWLYGSLVWVRRCPLGVVDLGQSRKSRRRLPQRGAQRMKRTMGDGGWRQLVEPADMDAGPAGDRAVFVGGIKDAEWGFGRAAGTGNSPLSFTSNLRTGRSPSRTAAAPPGSSIHGPQFVAALPRKLLSPWRRPRGCCAASRRNPSPTACRAPHRHGPCLKTEDLSTRPAMTSSNGSYCWFPRRKIRPQAHRARPNARASLLVTMSSSLTLWTILGSSLPGSIRMAQAEAMRGPSASLIALPGVAMCGLPALSPLWGYSNV